VVEDATEVIISLSDRREFIAEVVGVDPLSDLAVLEVSDDDLPTVNVGNSDELRVGDWVIAIGSPFSFDFSVTAGIVSAKGRSINNNNIGNYVPFLQTDVAINPGNSGGPLFNLDGEVVGINSQIYSRSGGYQGLAFAIPINVAMDVADQIINDGEVSRGYLGVRMSEVDSDLADALGMEKPYGALINDIEENTFKKDDFTDFANKNNAQIKNLTLKNIDDTSKFNSKSLKRIFELKSGSIFVLPDENENYLMTIVNEKIPKIDINSTSYKNYQNKAKELYTAKIYKSYDSYINPDSLRIFILFANSISAEDIERSNVLWEETV